MTCSEVKVDYAGGGYPQKRGRSGFTFARWWYDAVLLRGGMGYLSSYRAAADVRSVVDTFNQ